LKIRKEILEEVGAEIQATKKEIVEIKEEKKVLLLKGLGALNTVAANTNKIAKLELKLEQLEDMYVELKLELKKLLESKLTGILLENNSERLQEVRELQSEQLEEAFRLNNKIWDCYDKADNISDSHHKLLNDISELIEDEELEIEHKAISILKYRNIQEARISFLDLKNYVFTGHTPTPTRKFKEL
ncbi:MAG: hypothetical protein RSD13_06585, partial [Clostridium sp.]